MLIFWSTVLYAQCPSTVITANEASYCISEYIELEASNIPSGSSLRWDLGDGFVNGNKIFKGTATSPGILSVDLELTLPNGTVCTYSNNSATNVLALPTPQFSVSRNLLCEGVDTVLLSDETTNSHFRSWVINGATLASTPQQAIYNITKATTQHITLIVEDSNGCTNSLTKNNAIRAYNDLDLDFSLSNTDHCLPYSTNLASSFNLGNQKINSYTWSLPGSNKTSSTSKDVSDVSYLNAGSYSVDLTIQTSQGCTYTLKKKNLVRLGQTATLGIDIPKSELCLSEKTVVTQTTNPLPGSFKWITPSFNSQKVSKYAVRLNYRDTGTYNITVEYNHNGCISTKTETSAIHVSGMKADFKSDNALHCESPHTVALVNHSDTTSGTVASYKWEIVDESNGTTILTSNQKEYAPTITASPISYSVQLITTSSLGCSDTALKKKFIQIRPYQFNFYAEPIIGCVDQEIKYTNKTPSASYYGLDLFSWDFYDKDSITWLGSSGSLSPTYTYTDTGHYYTKLTAANPLGCQETFTKKSVWIIKPNMQFELEDTIMCLSDSVKAIGSSTPSSPLLRHSYTLVHQLTGNTYQFYGDSAYFDVPEVGAYDIKYTYGAQDECRDTISKTLWVNGVKGSISLDSASGCAPFVVQPSLDLKYNYHVGNTDTNLKYNWVSSPKNGTSLEGSSNAQPVVNILKNGNFSVQTFIINSTGCGQYINSSRISTGIKAAFKLDKIKAWVGDTIEITSTTKNSPTSLTWSILNGKTGIWDSISFETRKLLVKDTGIYEISLFVNKDDACFDTITRQIEIGSIEASFSAMDSLIGCAPATLQLENLASNADQLIWYFGD